MYYTQIDLVFILYCILSVYSIAYTVLTIEYTLCNFNTAIESFQTDRLQRVFHSCYFHYSEYTLCNGTL